MTLCVNNHLERLPYKCLWPIFEYLSVDTLRDTRLLNRFFKLISDADRVWQHHTLPLLKRVISSAPLPTSGFRLIFYQKRTSLSQTRRLEFPFSLFWDNRPISLLRCAILVADKVLLCKVKWWSLSSLTDGLISHEGMLSSSASLLNWGTGVVDYPRINSKPQYCEVRISTLLSVIRR